MKKFFFYLIAAVAVCCMTACGSDDDPDPGKIELANGQSNKMSCWSNTSSGAITFKASGAWIATVEAVSRAGADWLHLDRTSGTAGDVTLNFTLDPNDTGASRSANIIITSGNSREIIGITQSAQANPDEPQNPALNNLPSLKNVFTNGYCLMYFDQNRFILDEKTFRVTSIEGNHGYCNLAYNDNKRTVSAASSFVSDSGQEITRLSYEIALCDDLPFARTLKLYENGNLQGSYEFEYDESNHVTRVVSEVNGYREDSRLIWENGNVKQVVTNFGAGKMVTDFTYTQLTNPGFLMLFDDQLWIDDGQYDELEMFYFCGLLGTSTKNLIKTSATVETEGSDVWRMNYTFQYALDGYGCPSKIVYKESGDEGTSTDYIDLAWTKLF